MNDPDKPILEPNTAYADSKATLQARGVADAEGLERSSAFVATTMNPLTDRSPTPRQTIAEALAAASETTTPAFHSGVPVCGQIPNSHARTMHAPVHLIPLMTRAEWGIVRVVSRPCAR